MVTTQTTDRPPDRPLRRAAAARQPRRHVHRPRPSAQGLHLHDPRHRRLLRESLGYPGLFAYLVILGEIGGGLALVLGVWTRAVSLLLLPIMIGATAQHVGAGWLFSAEGGGWEFPVFWTVALVVQALLGNGAWALKPADLFPRLVTASGQQAR